MDTISLIHIIQEVIEEAEETRHSTERIWERIRRMGIAKGLELDNIFLNLQKVKDMVFPKRYSFAVMLGQVVPDPSSPYFYEIDGRKYYQVTDSDTLADSTGDQIWAVIRDNVINTIMLRKAIQTKDPEHNKEKMRVDYSIKNIDKFKFRPPSIRE